MALLKPLVIKNGQIEQIQSGDTVVVPDYINMVADSTLIPGNVVYASAAGHVDKAKADASGTVKTIGLAVAAISSAGSGPIQNDGVLTLTTGQWDAAAGTTGGLTFNTEYYLSAGTAGLLTSTAPTTVGQYVAPIGIALSTTDLLIYTNKPNVLL